MKLRKSLVVASLLLLAASIVAAQSRVSYKNLFELSPPPSSAGGDMYHDNFRIIADLIDPMTQFGRKVVIVNPYEDTKDNTYQGQLHCHSDQSDGADSPTDLETAYQGQGYDFIVLTDHNTITSDPSVASILHIDGNEESGNNFPNITQGNHIGATNPATNQAVTDSQTIIDALLAEGAFLTINHPNWDGGGGGQGYPWTDEELTWIQDYHALEIFNASITEDNAEDRWDAVLSRNLSIHGIAADDCHDISDNDPDTGQFNRAWVQVHADTLSTANIVASLKNGNFYSSTGPTLTVSVSGTVITATADSASTITFIMVGGATAQTTDTVSAETYTIIGNEKYVRVKVTRDSDGKFAWSNPIYVRLQATNIIDRGGSVIGDLKVTGGIGVSGDIDVPSGNIEIAAGRMGVNTTSPQFPHHIKNNSDGGETIGLYLQNDFNTDNTAISLAFGATDDDDFITAKIVHKTTSVAGSNRGLHFLVWDGVGGVVNEKMAILADGVHMGDETNEVVVSSTGDQTFTGSAGFYPRVLTQDGEPAAGTGATQVDSGEVVMWIDTNDSNKVYLVYNNGGTVVTVLMP